MATVYFIFLLRTTLLGATLAVIALNRDFQQSMGYGQFIQHNNSYLDVPKLRSENITDQPDCAISCVILPKCLSYNVASTTTDGKYLCEILETDKYQNSSSYKASANFQHYSILTPCTSNPCKDGATCIPNYRNSSFKCVCVTGKYYDGTSCEFKDCAGVYKAGERQSGVYSVDPDGYGAIKVYCDMVTDGGGWTVIQRRKDGSVDFYRDWASYKHGFGSLSGEFWLGNDNIHRLSSSGNRVLRVELEDWKGNTAYAKYGTFDMGGESYQYNLTVGSYSGTLGDSLFYHNGMRFSTKDRDNDLSNKHCARYHTGAWWYSGCQYSSLNGQYLGNVVNAKGLNWYHWKINRLSMKSTQMKIRHV